MNKYLFILIAFITLLQLGTIIYLAKERTRSELVFIDSAQLLNEYKGMIAARAAYQKKYKAWQAEVDTLISDIEKMIIEHEKSIPDMTSKERELSEALIRSKQNELKRFQEAVLVKAKEAESQMTGQVLADINAFINDYGKENGYNLILGATTMGNIAYGQKELNITERLVKVLNQNYVGK